MIYFDPRLQLTHQFKEGLYVLLPPSKKGGKFRKNGSTELDLPLHLRPLVTSRSWPEVSCSWHLSGPQYPISYCGIQKRYCYPTDGLPSYEQTMSGILCTAFVNGKEDLSFRLFHVLQRVKAKTPNVTSKRTVLGPSKPISHGKQKTLNHLPPNKRYRVASPPGGKLCKVRQSYSKNQIAMPELVKSKAILERAKQHDNEIQAWLLCIFPVEDSPKGKARIQEYAEKLEEVFFNVEFTKEAIKSGALSETTLLFMNEIHRKHFLKKALLTAHVHYV